MEPEGEAIAAAMAVVAVTNDVKSREGKVDVESSLASGVLVVLRMLLSAAISRNTARLIVLVRLRISLSARKNFLDHSCLGIGVVLHVFPIHTR